MRGKAMNAGVRAGTLLLAVGLAAGCQHGAPESAPVPEKGGEPVNVGYGTVERRNLTGAVSTITAAEIDQARVNTVAELFSGRVAGVQVVQTPLGLSLRVRGAGTLFGSGEPLIVLDGVPVYAPGATILAALDPGSIARIEVLKDAGSAAIYGSRGGNGVVLITTKRSRDR